MPLIRLIGMGWGAVCASPTVAVPEQARESRAGPPHVDSVPVGPQFPAAAVGSSLWPGVRVEVDFACCV